MVCRHRIQTSSTDLADLSWLVSSSVEGDFQRQLSLWGRTEEERDGVREGGGKREEEICRGGVSERERKM